MNVVNHTIEIHCTQKDIPEISQVLIHSLIFFRSYGKFNYSQGSSFAIGSLGYEMIDCDHLDFSYVRYTCPSLLRQINSKLHEFFNKLSDSTQTATLTLEFYKQRPSNWPFNTTKMNWEMWNIKFVIKPASSSPTVNKLEDVLRDKMFDIIRTLNSEKSPMPLMPMKVKLDTIFDTNYNEMQPYLHELSYKISENLIGLSSSNSSSLKNLDGSLRMDPSRQSSIKKFLLGTLEL